MSPSTACPICAKPAKQNKAAVGDYMEVDCRHCGRFQISRIFQHAVSDSHETERRQALEHARLRARYGALPIITTYDLP